MATNYEISAVGMTLPVVPIVNERRTLLRRCLDNIKEEIIGWWYTGWVPNVCCCTNPRDLADLQHYSHARLEQRRALMTSLSYSMRECIIQATIDNVVEVEGYDMRLHATVVERETVQVQTKQKPRKQRRRGCGKSRSSDTSNSSITTTSVVEREVPLPTKMQQARIVPRFSAAVVVAVRARIGVVSLSDANRLLVEREALRLMRDNNVREVDRSTHLPYVLDCYFSDTVHYDITSAPSRLPRLLRWVADLKLRPNPGLVPPQ